MRRTAIMFGLAVLAVAGGLLVRLRPSGRADGRQNPAASAPALVSSGPFTLIAEPAAGVGPFRAMIHGARRSIELTMYELTDPRVEDALIAAARRGVDVRVLLNGGYYSERESTNDAAARALAAGGVHVRRTPTSFALTHQKTLTVDGTRTAIMTLNFDGRYGSTRDFAVVDRRPGDVAAVVATFDDDWVGRRSRPSAGSGVLVWSPGAAGAVVGLIGSARRSVALEDEEMADAPATAALCADARRGVHVTVVMTYSNDWRTAFEELTRCGVAVRVDHGQAYYIHAKAIVVDDHTALVSSQNLSPTSLDDNRELGVRVTAPALVHALAADIAADAAGAQRWSP